MAKKRWTRNQKILMWGVIVAAIAAIVTAVGLFVRAKQTPITTYGDGAAVGDNATVIVDRRPGVEP